MRCPAPRACRPRPSFTWPPGTPSDVCDHDWSTALNPVTTPGPFEHLPTHRYGFAPRPPATTWVGARPRAGKGEVRAVEVRMTRHSCLTCGVVFEGKGSLCARHRVDTVTAYRDPAYLAFAA